MTKSIYAEWPPLTVAAGRWLLATLIFAVYLPVRGESQTLFNALRTDLWPIVRFGFIGVAVLYAVQNVALAYTTAANASVLGNLVPLFVAVLSVLFLGEQLTHRLQLGVFAATIGAILFSLQGNAVTVAPEHLLGDGLTLLSAVAGAIYVVQGKAIVDKYPPLVVTALAAGVGTAFLLPLALVVDGLPPLPSLNAWGGLVGLGLGASVLANLAWWHVAEALPASRAAVFILLVPVTGAIFGVAIMHDPLTPLAILGAGMILSGVYMAEVE
jgi:drug/metabolite transporter (DMT)-like permease